MKQALLFFLFLFSFYVHCQEFILPTKQVTFGTNTHTNRDILQSSLVDSENNIYLLGSTENDFTFNDIQIIKVNQNLEEIWTKSISFNTDFSYDRIIKSFIDSNDNLTLVCKSFFTRDKEKIFVIRLDKEGNEIWRLPFTNELNPDSGINWRHVYANMQNGILYLLFGYNEESGPNTMNWHEISSNGVVTAKYGHDDILGHGLYPISNFEFDQNQYSGIIRDLRQNIDITQRYKLVTLNKSSATRNTIPLTEEQANFVARSEDHHLIASPNGGKIWIVNINFYFNLVVHRGYMLFYLNDDGTVLNFKDIDYTKDKFIIGQSFDENGNLIVVSNNKNRDTEDPLKISIQKYSPLGELIYENTYPLEMAGIMAFFSENKILVYAENNTIFEFDMDLSFQNRMPLNPIQALFFDPINLHVIGDYRFLTGTKESSMYEGSDFLGQRDFSIKKTSPNASELGEYLFSGKGTSKVRKSGILKGDDGNYYVGVTENIGPDNLGIGGSRGPKVPHLLTYSVDFEIIDQKINNTDIDWSKLFNGYGSNRNPFTLNGVQHEYLYDPATYTLTLFKNNSIVWTRNWAESSHPSHFRVSNTGELFFKSPGKLNKVSLTNELYSTQLNNHDIIRMIILDNGWIFTTNKYSIKVFGEDLSLINQAPLPAGYVFEHPGYNPILQVNNHVLFYTGNIVASKEDIGIIKVFNQFGKEVNTYSFYDDIHPQYSFMDNNDLIVLGQKKKNIVREFSWEVCTLNKYEDFANIVVGESPSGDTDNDGISDFIDRCPNTLPGTAVNQYGCNLIEISDENFAVKTVGESCPSSGNGQISITALESLNYQAKLWSDDTLIENRSFTKELKFEHLSSGLYKVCITTENLPEYEQCFNLNLTAPNPLNVESKLNLVDNKLDLKLSGSEAYTIKINDETFITIESEISIPLENTINLVQVLGEKDCQGSFEQLVVLDDKTKVYPNPTDGELSVFLGLKYKNPTTVMLYNTLGKLVHVKTAFPLDGKIKVDLQQLPVGQYYLIIQSDKTKFKHKIIKK